MVVPSIEGSPHAFVSDSLRFEGTYPAWAFHTSAAVQLDGFGTIPTGTSLHSFESSEAGVIPTVSLSWWAPRGPFSLDDVVYRVQIRLPEQPCQSIEPPPQSQRQARVDVTGDLVFGPPEVVLRERPDAGRELRLRGRVGVALLALENRRAWIRVRVPSSHGAELEGWVRADVLSRVPIPPERGALLGASERATELGGRPARARLRRGARVFSAPEQSGWATVATNGFFDVRVDLPESPWVLIEAAPGIRIVGWDDGRNLRRGQYRMWVRQEDVLELQARL